MSHRIDIELTSDRGDGSWTWRAAGARQPKGLLDASLLPAECAVGMVVRAEAESDADGIRIVSVAAPKRRERAEPERIEILGTRRDEPAVTTQLAGGRKRFDDEDGERGRRGGRQGRGPGSRGDGRGPDRRDRRDGDRRPSGDRGREQRSGAPRGRPGEDRAPRPERPRAPRLRPGRSHRQALLNQLPAEQRPLAEIVLRGGVPLVRETLDKQRRAAETEGIPSVKAEPVIDVAEKLAPHARLAEWQDRADAAIAQSDTVDLRDLRSVVVAADGVARHEQTRETAERLRAALTARVESEHRAWLGEVNELVVAGRAVAALRLSSRPPKAGIPLPPPLAASLAELATAQLLPDTHTDRYCAVLEAVALSPVRTQVNPTAVPPNVAPALAETVGRLGDRIPQIAATFGIEPVPQPAGGQARRGPRPASRR